MPGAVVCLFVLKIILPARSYRVDDDFEIISLEVKGSNPKCTWEFVGLYRSPNVDVRVIESLAARTCFIGNSMKRSIIGRDLNLPEVDWKGVAEGISFTQGLINRWVWENGYSWGVGKPTRGDFYWTFRSFDPKVQSYFAVRLKGSVTICGVLLDVEGLENKRVRATNVSSGYITNMGKWW